MGSNPTSTAIATSTAHPAQRTQHSAPSTGPGGSALTAARTLAPQPEIEPAGFRGSPVPGPQSTAFFLLLLAAFAGLTWWLAIARKLGCRVVARYRQVRAGIIAGGSLIQFKDPCVQHEPLVQRGAQRPVQPVFQIEFSPPADDMGEEVTVERRVLSQHLLQVEHVLRGDELVEPHGTGRYLGPLARTPRMIGIGPSLSDLLEDHIAQSR